MKQRIIDAAEAEEQKFYDGGSGDEWLAALEPIGTGTNMLHNTTSHRLIVVFAQHYGLYDYGSRYKHYFVPESMDTTTCILITALHNCGLSKLTHTPNLMSFMNDLCQRPKN